MVSLEWSHNYATVYEIEKQKADQWNRSGEGQKFWKSKIAREEQTERVEALSLTQTAAIFDVWKRYLETENVESLLKDLEDLMIESTRQEWNFPEAKLTFQRDQKMTIFVGNNLFLIMQ